MKKRLSLILLFLVTPYCLACAISPFYQITEDPQKYANSSNAIFFGKLVDLEAKSTDVEVATFSVLERIKGDVEDTVQVTNIIKNNCSQHFGQVGSAYYVFGNVNESGNQIKLDGFPIR